MDIGTVLLTFCTGSQQVDPRLISEWAKQSGKRGFDGLGDESYPETGHVYNQRAGFAGRVGNCGWSY